MSMDLSIYVLDGRKGHELFGLIINMSVPSKTRPIGRLLLITKKKRDDLDHTILNIGCALEWRDYDIHAHFRYGAS